MNNEVTLYTLTVCPRCAAAKKRLDANGVTYTVVNLDEHPEKAEQFKARGIMAAPILTVGDYTYSTMSSILDFCKSFSRT